MCDICDGLTFEESFARTHRLIETYGYTMQAVAGRPPWVYTIGLVREFDHPELVVTGIAPESAMEVLEHAVDHIELGADYSQVGFEFSLFDVSVRVGAVHPMQWAMGRFNSWLGYYNRARSTPDARVVQLVLDDPKHVCSLPRDECQPMLDIEPLHDVNGNRAQRRATSRGRRR